VVGYGRLKLISGVECVVLDKERVENEKNNSPIVQEQVNVV
jgi:hypothetical protein